MDYTVQRYRRGYAIVYRDVDGNWHRAKLRANERSAAEAEARVKCSSRLEPNSSVGFVVVAYIGERQAEGIASSSRQRDAWKAMKPFWDDIEPRLIDREMAQSYARYRNVADATVRYELGMLSVALRWAVNKDLISKAPEIRRPDPPERKVRHLNRAEFERWFEHVKAPHARLYVELGLASMARPTAILELTWDRVDFERGTVDLNPRGRRQTRKRRPIVPLNDDALAALREERDARQSGHVIERGGKQITSIKKAFQAASARAGIHVTPYTPERCGRPKLASVWPNWPNSWGTTIARLPRSITRASRLVTLRRVANAVQRTPKLASEVQLSTSDPCPSRLKNGGKAGRGERISNLRPLPPEDSALPG